MLSMLINYSIVSSRVIRRLFESIAFFFSNCQNYRYFESVECILTFTFAIQYMTAIIKIPDTVRPQYQAHTVHRFISNVYRTVFLEDKYGVTLE